MMKLLVTLTLLIGLMSCGGKVGNVVHPTHSDIDHVEIIYFHGKQRCVTCKAIEEGVNEVIETYFAKAIKDGTVVFRIIDISTPEGETLADGYEVSWSSLFVNNWNGGKETRDNLTEFAFANAVKRPKKFKEVLIKKINQSLK